MSVATTIQPVVERAKIHREFSIVMRRGIHRDVSRRPDLSAIAYRDVTMLIETRRNYTEPTQSQPPSLPPLLCLRDVLGYHDLCVTQLLLFREQSAGIRAQGSRRFA